MQKPQGSKSTKNQPFKLATVTAFVLLNGIVLATLAFFMVRLSVDDMKRIDAQASTRDVIRSAEVSLKEFEKTVGALSATYLSAQGAPAQAAVLKALAGYGADAGVVWMTEDGVWKFDAATGGQSYETYNAAASLPAFADMDDIAAKAEFNRLHLVTAETWPAFGASKRVAGIVKLRLENNKTAYVAVVAPVTKAFGAAWSGRRDTIGHVDITAHNRSDVKIYSETIADHKDVRTVSVKNVVQAGNGYVDIFMRVRPTTVSPYLDASPYAAALLIVAVAILAAIIAQRKSQQDQTIAEMSETLEGAHAELQSKQSERERLVQALRRSERENRAIINSVSDVIFETDEHGKLIFLNETWKRMMSRDSAEAIGHDLFGYLDPADQKKQRDYFEQMVRGERQAYREETRIDLGNGNLKPVELAFSMLRVAEDKKVRVVGTLTDIEKRRRAENALRAAEQRFRSIFENALSGIYQTSPDGRFLNANPALAEMLGYASAEELMMGVGDIGRDIYVNPEDRQKFASKLMFEGRISGVESQLRRKDGRLIWILENARVVHSDKGGVAYFEGSVSDITEHKEAEQAIKEARLQAEISSRSRMEFLANMSHELRTPLNAIIGFSEIIKDEIMGPVGVKEYKDYARDIYDSGNGLLRVISEILEVSKIATGHRELNISTFKLSRAVKSSMIIMGSRIQQSGVDVSVNLPDDLPELMAEELGLKQVMLNLLSNAVKFTMRGGKVEVTARVIETGEMQIDVTDTGIGMTADEIRRAMEPFAKVDMSFGGMKEGTGLGLNIAESIIKLHGGELKLLSEKGKGTTARIIMPAFRVMRDNRQTDSGHLKIIK